MTGQNLEWDDKEHSSMEIVISLGNGLGNFSQEGLRNGLEKGPGKF